MRRARVCGTVAGLVLQGTQVTNADPWMRDKEVLHACRQLAMIMKDIEGSLDDAQDDFEGMRMKSDCAVEATTLGIKTKSGLRPNCRNTRVYIHVRRLYNSSLILWVPVLVTSHGSKDGVIRSRTDSRVKVTRRESV